MATISTSPYVDRPSRMKSLMEGRGDLFSNFNPIFKTRINRTLSINPAGGAIGRKMKTEHLNEETSSHTKLQHLSTDADFSNVTVSLPHVPLHNVSPELPSKNHSSNHELLQHIDDLIKQEYTVEHLSKIICTECNYITVCRIYVLMKDGAGNEWEKFDFIKDSKFQASFKMAEIYSTISVLMVIVLRELSVQTLRLIAPTLKSIFVNYNEMLLLRLESIMDECTYSRQLTSKSIDIKRLLEQRNHELGDPKKKGFLIAQTYKLKDSLVQMYDPYQCSIKKQPKYLALFSYHMQGFNRNCPAAIIEHISNEPKFGYLIYPNKKPAYVEPNRSPPKPPQKQREYTLFLDLDETLVHYMESTEHLLIRPYAQVFLKQLSKSYEIVIFTAASKKYADWVIDNLDTSKVVSKRLYRHDTTMKETTHLKDIQKAGRSIDKSLIVDNVEENFSLHPANGIKIKGWYGERSDRVLRDLFPVLKLLAMKPGKDLREEIEKLKPHKHYSIYRHGFCIGV